MVSLPGGRQVRERFTSRIPIGENGAYEVTIQMRDGKPHLEHFELDPEAPIAPDELARVDLVKLVDLAMIGEVLTHIPSRLISLDEATDADIERLLQDLRRELSNVHSAVRRSRWRRVTPDFLRSVLDAYEAGDEGIKSVMKKFNYSERNARRLLARARKELQ
jgi:hypothetical protein